MKLLRPKEAYLELHNLENFSPAPGAACFYGTNRIQDVSRDVMYRLFLLIPFALIILSRFEALQSLHRAFALHTLSGVAIILINVLSFVLDYDYNPYYGNCVEIAISRIMEVWFITGELFLGYMVMQVGAPGCLSSSWQAVFARR